MEYLDGHKNEFDVIIFNDVIEHFTKDEVIKVYESMKNSLKMERFD